MLLAPRYSDLDLPIYDAEDVTLADVRNLNGYGRTALRSVAIEFGPKTPPPKSLKKLLDITDIELEAAANACRANVVGHKWGLVHDPDAVHYSSNKKFALSGNVSGLVPKDHFLVADVDIVKDVIEMRARNTAKILANHAMKACAVGIGTRLYPLLPHEEGYRLWDLLPSQCVLGLSVNPEGDDEYGMWLVDIEPRLTSN